MGSNAETARGIYEAFGRGDVPAVLGAMDENILWEEPQSLPFEDQRGPQAVAENIFGMLVTQIDGFGLDVREIVDAGDTVFAIGSYQGKGKESGAVLDADFVHLLRFGADGKLTYFRTYTDTHIWREALGVS